MQEWITEGRVYFGQDGQGAPQLKRYLNEVQQGIVPTTYWGYDEVGHTDSARKDLKSVFDGVAPFDNPKPVGVIQKSLLVGATKDAIVLDFFAGSGTTGEAVMRLNAEDGGQRQFILVQIPQPIDPKKQKEAHSFVTQTLGKPEATIFEITAERLRRAGDKINAAQRSQGKPEVDAGFRVYTLADDPHALVHRTPLDQATQADVAALQTAIATPQPEQRPVVLANLLLTEGLPLSATLTPLAAGSVADALWQAQDTLLVLDAVPLDALVDLLRQRKAAGTPVHHVSVYAPWVHDDNFLQGVQTLLEAEGFSADRLRLRG
jgi:adenine-specific DNA-methyltransferase